MSPQENPIIEKIRKLQALADRAGTEGEAAAAASRVAELCRKHHLDIGTAILSKEETEASESKKGTMSQAWSAHWNTLNKACEMLFNVGAYRTKLYRKFKKDGYDYSWEYALVFFGLDRKSTRLNSSHLGISY